MAPPSPTRTAPAQVALSVTLLAEARELLSALRRNRRFAYLLPFSSASPPSDHPLVNQLKTLRDVIRVPPTAPSHSPLLIPPDALLAALDPFFDVVRSRDASGIITAVALLSLSRISTRLIHLLALSPTPDNLPSYIPLFSAVIDAAASCRFDATDPASDEVVLARITHVISSICVPSVIPMLSDALLLRAVEACLAIASGRRRASDLLKRTADLALVHVFNTLAHALPQVLDAAPPNLPTPPSVFAPSPGPAFGYALDAQAFAHHGPASPAVYVALLQLSSRMIDPAYAQTPAERDLGLQLLSTLVVSAGPALRSPLLSRVILRDAARGLLRSLGLFKSPSSIANAFTISVQIIHALGHHAAPFLLALLQRVFPYYISGLENVLPRLSPTDSPEPSAPLSGSPPSGSSGNLEVAAVELDPVIREIGLEALADLLSTPGLLSLVYRLSDCDMAHPDVVQPLLKALGHAAKITGLRRRSKRLRASTSGASRMSGPPNADTDDDDDVPVGKGATDSSRFSRASALLCADAVLAVIDTISDRLKLETAGLAKPPAMDKIALQKSLSVRKAKMRLQDAAATFNSSEKFAKASKLLPLLREHGLVSNRKDAEGTVNDDFEDDVSSIVRFVKDTPGLSKEKIGSVLSEPDKLSQKVLADYTAAFDFEHRPFTESLRVYLESFRLPGEAQKIDRIVQSFANRFFAQNQPVNDSPSSQNGAASSANEGQLEVTPIEEDGDDNLSAGNGSDGENRVHTIAPRPSSVLKSADAAYVLSFSVVMLNTDQHNESIRKKMSLDDFVKNCRGINDGEDLPGWFLSDVFDSIAAVEIRMSDEAGVGALTDLVWDEHLKKAGAFELEFPRAEDSHVFDEHVFVLSWEAGIVAANSIINEAGEANAVQKALEGFLSISRCATTFKISLPTDAVISSLCTATTIREGPLLGAVIRFGTDIKAQMASVALSGVSRECGDWIREDGWEALVAYLLRLHALCLLPVDLERRIGGYGSELVGVKGEQMPPSTLSPPWWPSHVSGDEAFSEAAKPKKATRPNGFFAAILAASIGSEIGSDDEEDDEHLAAANGSSRRRPSNSQPFYIRTRSREDTEARDLARKCIASCRIEDMIINEAKILQSDSLGFLCKAISQSALRILDAGKRSPTGDSLAHDEGDRPAWKQESVLDWADISPPSPRNSASVITGVVSRRNVMPTDAEGDFSAFGLAPSWDGALREKDERKAREFVVSFCIDVLCELTLENRDRLHIPWPELYGLLMGIIAPATEASPVLERAVVALLRIGVRLLHREELRDDVLRGFNLLVRLPSEIANILSIPVAAGILNIVKGHGNVIKSTSGWHAILSILESLARYHVQARQIGLETIRIILSDVNSPDAVSLETYAPLLDAILAYTSCSSVDVSIEALEMLYLLSERLLPFNEKGGVIGSVGGGRLEDVMWNEFWGPLFLGFASAVRDARGKVRNCALGVLERVIASGGSTELLTAGQWDQLLSGVLLPLMTQVFTTGGYLTATLEAEKEAQRRIFEEKNAVVGGRGRGRSFATSAEHEEMLVKSVSAACGRTRMRAIMLTSKTFLQHHVSIATGITEDKFTELWIGVLEVFRVAAVSGANVKGGEKGSSGVEDDVKEHVPESVKNLLLVMYDCGLLRKEQHVRWNATFSMVSQFVADIEEVIMVATEGRVDGKESTGDGNSNGVVANGTEKSSEEKVEEVEEVEEVEDGGGKEMEEDTTESTRSSSVTVST